MAKPIRRRSENPWAQHRNWRRGVHGGGGNARNISVSVDGPRQFMDAPGPDRQAVRGPRQYLASRIWPAEAWRDEKAGSSGDGGVFCWPRKRFPQTNTGMTLLVHS